MYAYLPLELCPCRVIGAVYLRMTVWTPFLDNALAANTVLEVCTAGQVTAVVEERAVSINDVHMALLAQVRRLFS